MENDLCERESENIEVIFKALDTVKKLVWVFYRYKPWGETILMAELSTVGMGTPEEELRRRVYSCQSPQKEFEVLYLEGGFPRLQNAMPRLRPALPEELFDSLRSLIALKYR